MAGGVYASLAWPAADLRVWLGAACAALCACVIASVRLRPWCLLLACLLLSGTWTRLRTEAPPSDVSHRLGDQPALFTIEGRLLASPTKAASSATSHPLARFRPLGPRSELRLRVFRVGREFSAAEDFQQATGALRVWVDGRAPAARSGDVVRVTGMARRLPGPTNPGEIDRRPAARVRGESGWMSVESAEALTVLDHAGGIGAWFWRGGLGVVEALRERSREWLEPVAARQQPSAALLRALLLGESEAELGELRTAFTRLGLVHVLSISGLNLTLLAGTVVWLFRLGGARLRIEALAGIVAIGLYLLVIPVGGAVLRAAIMTACLLAPEAFGRRYDRLTMLGWAAVLVLWWRPTELLSPGFQLSFGVVAALLTLVNPLRERLFGLRPEPDTIGQARWLLECVKDAALGAVVAWAIASPLVMFHVGVFSPLGAVSTLVLMPLVSLLMVSGYAALIVAVVWPGAGALLAAALRWPAEALAQAVLALDALPGSAVFVPAVSVWWCLAASAVLAWWMVPAGLRRAGVLSSGPRWPAAARWACSAAVMLWTAWLWAAPALPAGTLARLDTLDVGDGACHVLRLRDESTGRVSTLMFDCGSLRLSIGQRTIPAAARALGAWRVPTVVLSHPNIDHYSGLLDVAGPLGVRLVCVGEAFEKAARADPDGPVAFVLGELERAGIEVRVLAAGDVVPGFEGVIDVLSPPRGREFRADNDASLVLRVHASALRQPGSPGVSPESDDPAATILFCGDAQREALAGVMQAHPSLRADVLEVPHHGSWNEVSDEFVRTVGTGVVVQSTGPQRLSEKRWDARKQESAWHVTAADGAASVIIRSDGEIKVERWKR